MTCRPVGRFFRLVAGSLVALMVSSWVTTAFVSVQYDYRARIEEPFAKFDELYDKPWTRLGPYLVGMITGWLLFKTNGRIRMSLVRRTGPRRQPILDRCFEGGHCVSSGVTTKRRRYFVVFRKLSETRLHKLARNLCATIWPGDAM